MFGKSVLPIHLSDRGTMDFLNWFRKSSSTDQHLAAHMTWARTTAGRTVSRAGLFLKRQLWIWPILAVILLSIIGWATRRAIETTMRGNLRSGLMTILSLETAMLETWIQVQQSNAESLANDLEVRQIIYQLLATDSATQPDATPATAEDLQEKLEHTLGPSITAHDYAGYLVADKENRILAANRPDILGKKDIAEYSSFLKRALEGEACVSPPFPSVVALKVETGRLQTGAPTMFVAAPVRDERFQVVAVLALRIRPEEEFSRILQLGQFSDSGETYAFDKEGRFASNSRFDEELITLRLLPDEEGSRSILRLFARDPGGDITQGYLPVDRRQKWPLTHMAAEAIAGRPGVNVEGYRDYRGVKVVGAWTWLPEVELGVATEVDYKQAFRPLIILQWIFWALLALLALSSIAIFVFTVMVARLRREAQQAAIDAQQIGQYTLDRTLGAGGMGIVYKGHHAMLRRPTAIKMLEPGKVSPASIERFEREVQITSQLNHPNTVAIYDYGHTPEGLFYYAMEYLDGIDLESIVERYGPQPVPRVIHVLLQVCGSLYEAHSLGLVHRDIKPANIMLNRRGGEPDVVKVLDFGLVKSLDNQKQAGLTQQSSLTGTPLYMSPEAIQLPNSVDARSDLYAVGAVGYFLLTGQPVFQADSVIELCQKHVEAMPTPPSERTGKPLPNQLEAAILACLEKSRAKRPQTARDLAQLLSRCPEAGQWSIEEADAWWGRHERGQATHSPTSASPGQPIRMVSDHAVTIDKR